MLRCWRLMPAIGLVRRAFVPHRHVLDCWGMSADLTTWIDRVDMIYTSTSGIPFDDLDAHDFGC